MADLTAPDSALSHSLTNIEKITSSLTDNNNIQITLQNFRDTSEKLKTTMRELEPVGRNLAEFSDTVKTQPWRLVYPTTKKYPEKSPTPSSSEATITVRKSAKPKASATPSRGSR